MTAYEMPFQGPARAPAPPIPALPGSPGAATAARRAAEAADAATAAEQAAQDPAIADAPPPPPPPFVTSTGFPVDPALIIREAIPIVGMSLAMMVVLFIGWPLARAFARRSDSRIKDGELTARTLQPQIRQLQESLDTMAVELERISEAQRFQAKLMAERAPALAEGQKRN